MDDSVMTVEEMRSQIRSWMVEHELRKKALDYDGALCVDGIEIEEDACIHRCLEKPEAMTESEDPRLK